MCVSPPLPIGSLAERKQIGSSESSFPRTSSRSSVAATCLLFLFTFSVGGPAFAQTTAAVIQVSVSSRP